jgi:proline iminopeptidase
MMKNLFVLIVFLIVNISVDAQSAYAHDSLEVDGGYIHYYTKGEGQPIVLLPGGPGFSHYYMRAISDSLDSYTSILIDFYGIGRSQYKKPDSTWVNQDHMVNDVELLRKHLAIERWVVLGRSWATHTALLYGITYPKHTARIILQATAGTDNSFLKYYGDNVRMRLTEADYAQLAAINKDSTSGRFDSFKIRFKGYFYDAVKASSFFNMPTEEEAYFYNGNFFGAFLRSPDYNSFDISKEAYQLDIPVRIIQGRQDPVNGGTQERLNERLKNSKIYYIERAGHFPWLEQSVAFFTALRASLTD